MRTRLRLTAGAATLAVLFLAAAGCGSSDSSSSSTTSTAAETSTPTAAAKGAKAVTIDVADNPDLGQILTDGDRNTVYLFEKDEGDESYCTTTDCIAAWPPVLTNGDVTAGSGADDSLIGTTQRDDGTEQVTYAGHPLYLYAGDTKPGETTGSGVDQFGAEWYALTPDGANAEGGDSSGESASGSEDSTSGDSTSTDESSTTSGSVY